MKMDEYRARLAEIRKPSKYRAKKTVVDGITFDSKREADRYSDLRVYANMGWITELRLQVRYDLHALGGAKVARYVADFVYRDRNGNEIVEDVKGVRTPLYNLKKKWMKAEHNIDIVET